MTVPLEPFLHLAAALLALGVYGLLTRKEPVASLLSLQIITHATVIGLVALDRSSTVPVGPQLAGSREPGFADAFAAVVVVLLGVQTVVGLCLIIGQETVRDATAGQRESRSPSTPMAAPGSARLNDAVSGETRADR